MNTARIVIQDLRFAYHESEEVIKGINLSFNRSATALIGENGSGKTTFVKLLKGLLRPISGSIYINGYNTATTTVAKLAKYIGLVFQNPNDQLFKQTLIDEVMFGPLNIGQPILQAKASAEKALEMVGLSNSKLIHPYDLGLSDRKLVCIAAVLAMDTDIIILDEPTIAQDYLGKEKIKQIIKELRDQGKLVIAITHDMDFGAETFERIIVFHDGHVLLDDDTKTVFKEHDLLKEFHLELPHITQLGRKFNFPEPLLTVDAFVDHIKNRNHQKPSYPL
ncbi:MAG: ATP-binding cassette domain-containing protein [Firmicutes bacterium]|nr:ATP-binding cassette domain-containing protein [Bacillota bacterium]